MDNDPFPPDLRGDFPPGTLTRGKEYPIPPRIPPRPHPFNWSAAEERIRSSDAEELINAFLRKMQNREAQRRKDAGR